MIKIHVKYLLILFILLFIPVVPFLQNGLPVTHDGQDHVVRIANFYASFMEGNIIPRWGNNLNWGFGHPVLMFLYPLPSYSASFFHRLGFTLVDSVKLVFVMSYIVSGFAMFYWAKKQWGILPGIISGLLYTYAPYRFVDMNVRGALGEHVAFVFLPLIMLCIYQITQVKQKTMWSLFLALTTAGLLLSHNAVTVMMVPILLFYCLFVVYYANNNRVVIISYLFGGFFLGGLLSAFFWIPAFFEGKYTLRDIVTQGEVLKRTVPLSWFVYSPWNYGGGNEFTKQVGFVQWILLALSMIYTIRTKIKSQKVFGIGLLLLFFLTLLSMTDVSLFMWQSISLLQKFQFPWRLLTIIVLLSSIIGGYAVSFMDKKRQLYVLVLVIIALIGSTFSMWQPKSFKTFEETFFTSVYSGTTDTGESSPIWSVRFMEYAPLVPMQTAEGNAIIENTSRTTTMRTYRVDAESKTRLVENTLYFPGWIVEVDGNPVPVEFQDPMWRGRMTFWVESGVHTVVVKFTDTKLRYVSNVLSVIGLVLCIAIVVMNTLINIKKQKT